MTALYFLTNEYRAAALALSELDIDAQTVADTLEGLSGELELKAQSVAYMVRSMEADAEACKAWAKTATERAKAIESRAEALRAYLQRCMEAAGIQKIAGPGIAISFRKSSAVVIDDLSMIPAHFIWQPELPPPVPDKGFIAAVLRDGNPVPGAYIEHRTHLAIK